MGGAGVVLGLGNILLCLMTETPGTALFRALPTTPERAKRAIKSLTIGQPKIYLQKL
jgi:hypothetical protein